MTSEKLLLTTANQSRAFLLQLTAELRQIRDVSLYNARVQGRVEVVEQGSVQYGSLRDFLYSASGQDTTMVHYIGHSSGQGLLLEGVESVVFPLATDALAQLLGGFGRLRFVFLNSCCSANIAQALLDAGVPTVIGTSVHIRDGQAVRVAGKFYEILGNVFNPPTLNEAFQQTRVYFENDSQNPLPSVNTAVRGSIQTVTDDGDEFAWQFYERDGLTDAQRSWRLLPASPQPPTVLNVRYVITPHAAGPVFSFFLSHLSTEQTWADDLLEQIACAFQYDGNIEPIWTDESPTKPTDYAGQLTDQLVKADYLFLLVDDAYSRHPMGQDILTKARQRAALGTLLAPPVLVSTGNIIPKNTMTQGFNRFPLSGEPLTTDLLCQFSDDLYDQWKRRFRQQRG